MDKMEEIYDKIVGDEKANRRTTDDFLESTVVDDTNKSRSRIAS